MTARMAVLAAAALAVWGPEVGAQTDLSVLSVFTSSTCDNRNLLANYEMHASGECESFRIATTRYPYVLEFDPDTGLLNVTTYERTDCSPPHKANNVYACAECIAIPDGIISIPGLFVNASCPGFNSTTNSTTNTTSSPSSSADDGVTNPNIAAVAAVAVPLSASFFLLVAVLSASWGIRHDPSARFGGKMWRQCFTLLAPPDPTCPMLCLRVPARKRVVITGLMAASLLLFAFGDTLQEATVHLSGTVADPQLSIFNQKTEFHINLFSSIQILWNNNSRALAAFIAVTSFGWPYTKLFILLLAWLWPLPEPRSGTALFWMDVLGKWAILDVFVVVFMVVTMYLRADLSATSAPFVVRMDVETLHGLHTFVTGCIVVIFATQAMIRAHKQHNHRTSRRTSSLGKRLSQNLVKSGVLAKPSTMVALFVSGIAACCLLVATFAVDFVEVEYSGLVGDEHMNQTLSGSPMRLSLFSIGGNLLDSHHHGSAQTETGAYYLVLVYFVVSFITPLALVCTILLLLAQHRFGSEEGGWAGREARRRALVVMEWLLGWAAVDVLFVVGALAGTAFENLLASVLDDLERELSKLIPSISGNLLSIRVHLLPVAWLMLVAVIAMYGVCGFMVAMVKLRSGSGKNKPASLQQSAGTASLHQGEDPPAVAL